MAKTAHTKKRGAIRLKWVGIILLCVLILTLFVWIAVRPAKKTADPPVLPESSPIPAAAATEAPTPVPTETPVPTAEPTPTPTPTPTAEPTPEPTASVTPVPVEPGSYTYPAATGDWVLNLRDNGTFTLTDPDGDFHTGEGWSQNEDGSISCGPTDIYQAPFAFSGGCSRWLVHGETCEPVIG